jgi:hypothetical protein
VTVGSALFTTWLSVEDTVLLLSSPLYCAVMVSVPTGRDEVASVATPLAMLGVPSVVVPFTKVTVPVTLAGRVAVSVTDCPTVEGLSEDVRATVGVAFPTTCDNVATDPLLLLSPLYVAVIVVEPIASVEVLTVATPFTTVTVPSTVESEVKVTVPVTVVGNVSVNVTELPYVEGFADEVRVDDGLAFVTARVVVAVPAL